MYIILTFNKYLYTLHTNNVLKNIIYVIIENIKFLENMRFLLKENYKLFMCKIIYFLVIMKIIKLY